MEGLGDAPTPILPKQELSCIGTWAQAAYLDALFRSSQRTVVDVVRLWNYVPEILSPRTPVTVVHLVRPPLNWVTGHMLPDVRHWSKSLFSARAQLRFFRRRSGYDNWRYQTIIETALADKSEIFSDLQLDHAAIANEPAFLKLLAFWWVANRNLARRLDAWNRNRTVTVTLSEFVADPDAVINHINTVAGWDNIPSVQAAAATQPTKLFKPSYSHVKPLRQSFRSNARNWAVAAERLGIPARLVNETALSGDLLHELLLNH